MNLLMNTGNMDDYLQNVIDKGWKQISTKI